MSTKLISYENLSAYDTLIKAWVDGSSATSQSNVIFRTVLYDSDNIYFYHKANAVKGTDTPDVTVPLTGSDAIKALAEISAIVTALGGEMAATAPYTVTFPNLTTEAKSTLVAAINEVDAHADANATAIGILNGNDTTTGSVAKSIKDAIAALDADLDASGTAQHSGTFVVSGVTEVDGVITGVDSVEVEAAGATAALDATLAAVAKSGDADDVAYDNTTSGLTATDVQAAIDEIKGGLGTAAAEDIATSAIAEGSTDDGLVSAAQVATFVAAEIAGLEGAMHFRGIITRQTGETDAQAIARVITDPEAGDVVVMSDNAKEYIYDAATGTPSWREVGDETEFVKKTTTIAGVDLQDNITKTELLSALNVEDGAEVNIIESVKVNGSALTPDANRAVDVLIAEGATNGTVAVNGSDVAVHGLGTAAYTASSAYDAAGTAAAAVAALDATPSQTAGTDGLALSLTEVDGVVTAISGSIAAGTYYDTTNYVLAQASDINALFNANNNN